MKILTAQDYDLVDCCDCALPSCGDPRKECESITGEGRVRYFIDDSLPFEDWYEQFYGQVKYQYQDSGDEPGHWTKYTVAPLANVWVGGVQVSTAVETVEQGGGDAYGLPLVRTFANAVSAVQATDAMISIISQAIDWDDEAMTKGTDCTSTTSDYYGAGVGNDVVTVNARYRFGVPLDFSTPEAPRSMWDMQWDEVFFPTPWQEWIDGGMVGAQPAQPSLISQRSWSWGGSMDEPFSPWYEVELPKGPGETRTVNVLTLCYRSTRLGVRPYLSGEAFNVEEPTLDFTAKRRSFNLPLI